MNINNMPGGLMQIVTYGSQDLFLTGTPEITFFRSVYRRHTNFSMESIFVDFSDPYGFGQISNLIVPKIGDLINNVYVQVTLPEIKLTRNIQQDNNLNNLLIQYKLNYEYINEFMKYNIIAYKEGIKLCKTINLTPELIISGIEQSYPPSNILESLKNNYISSLIGTIFTYQNTSIVEGLQIFKTNGIVNSYVTRREINNRLNYIINKCLRLNKYYYTLISKLQTQINDTINTNAKIAWVKRIGHAIIEYISVSIGGTEIDKHYGEWIDIWHDLSRNMFMDEIYKKMIGDIPSLYIPTRNGLSKYTITIPLQFWFCRHTGLALPLIALQYHDVIFTIKFRKLEECLYISELSKTELDDMTLRKNKIINLGIQDISNLNYEMTACFMIDYIYLDSQERKKFAQSSHEYLIEQLQLDENIYGNKLQVQYSLNFTLASKELIWIAHNEKDITYIDGYEELQWTKYTTTLNDKELIPINKSNIIFNTYDRVISLPYQYYNYVQPYTHHSNTPKNGVNVYSFSLYPQEFQPSGFCNMNKIQKIVLSADLNDELIKNNNNFIVRVYSLNYNILRFVSGMSSLAIV